MLMYGYEIDIAILRFKQEPEGRNVGKRSIPETFVDRLKYIGTVERSGLPRVQICSGLRPYAYVSGVYVFSTWLTRPFLQGDTSDYAASIVAQMRGGYYEFWEFGHLLWRPLGWLAFRVSNSFLARFVGGSD